MLGPPTESPALHAGLVVAAVAFLAVAGTLPARPAPDATGVADTVDAVAAGPAPAGASHDHGADAVRLRPHGIAMRNDAGTARATFAFGPVVPVDDGELRAVLREGAPQAVFSTRAAFREAVEAALAREPSWIASDEITVTGVDWDGYRVTLVGA
ncbi:MULTISPECIES: DUF7283 family protein [Halolamina]|uniref:Uncharacterized protein n=1 Tax=Halolamina pelagica TaxID=699431 RepID=A0A1I5R2V8_9EURY|nr:MULTISPECIES: hypothetical protein [Halolamina]NHX35645.1 hypothetical protein [Halolamina sp. R1-12]SFP52386.1 hypothetical protein SAMN05216277_104195 [Halolamina pelagica]